LILLGKISQEKNLAVLSSHKKFMKKVISSIFALPLLISSASAKHPDLVDIIISNKEYVCHPKGTIKYCPDMNLYDSILEGLDQKNCLENLDPDNVNSNEISNCFIREHLNGYFNQLQLMDMSYSCILEKLTECKEVHYNCSEPPCGHLGGFLKKLKDLNLQYFFDEQKGKETCDKLIF